MIIRTQEIVESVLDRNSAEVITTIAGYVAKTLIKWSKCESLLGDVDIANDAYLNILFRDGLFVPSKSLADFACSNFTILDFLERDIVALSLPVKISTTNVLLCCGPESDFNCVNHLYFVNHQ